MTQIVTRFAPSPTGRLHLGHAYSALFGWRTARTANGRFLLRIEDIDPGRCRPEFEAGILEDLAWLGLDWEAPVWRQSERLDEYAGALANLESAGLLYPCFCTRKDIQREIAAAAQAPHGPDGPIYPGTCRHLDTAERTDRVDGGAPYALRLRLDEALRRAGSLDFQDQGSGTVTADPAPFGDVVLARKDIPTSYHLAVVVDDAAQDVTLVTRGADLRPATHLHRLLQHLLDLPVPDYAHHRLLSGPDGRRLAKRDRSLTIQELRDSGHDPATVRQRAEAPEKDG